MAKRSQGRPGSSARCTPLASAVGRRPGQASQLGGDAMAVLSALLKSLQCQEAAGGQVSVVSPQHSEIVLRAAVGAAECCDVSALQLPEAGLAEEEVLSDPLDIASLLPENGGGIVHLEASKATEAQPTGAAAVGAERAQKPATKASPQAADARNVPLLEQEPGSFSIHAVRSRQEASSPGWAAATSSSASSSPSPSSITAPPAKVGTSPARDSCRSPNSASRLSRLLPPCRRPTPHATLSSTAEAGRPSILHHRWR